MKLGMILPPNECEFCKVRAKYFQDEMRTSSFSLTDWAALILAQAEHQSDIEIFERASRSKHITQI